MTDTRVKETPLSKPFWDACRQHRLVVPRCRACSKHFFPPDVACIHCWSTDWEWVPASGKARLYSFAIVHRAPSPAFRVPYVFAAVRLEEGIDLFSHVVEADPESLSIDLPLVVVFDEVAPGQVLPRFKPA